MNKLIAQIMCYISIIVGLVYLGFGVYSLVSGIDAIGMLHGCLCITAGSAGLIYITKRSNKNE